ncbi:MAG: hypothetical protein H7Y27_02840, partial [Gemmatimonadaceae bacterium]|nr:hypothetical protein [Chitinophagaceae bacterium]
MKKAIIAALGLAAVFATSCKKDYTASEVEKPLIIGTTVDTLTGDILVNTVVTRTTFLNGIVYVRPGVTLTINAGVTILGKTTPFGTAPDLLNLTNNKGCLVIEKGADLIANGTANSPIIWTSTNSVGGRNVGDWGGVVILGDAPIKTQFGATFNNFEAFNTLTNGRNSYGGSNAADNSGSMTYNRIEFAGGTVTAANAEVNGLTLCGVGSSTVLNHIEVSNSGDDAFEFFGGTVNADHLLSYSNKDDDFDFDEGYRGNLQFIIAYRTDVADNSGSEMIELDGNASAAFFSGSPRTRPFIANATLIGPSSDVPRVNPGGTSQAGRFDGAVYTRRNGRLALLNSLVISQAFPTAFATSPTTNASFFGARPPLDGDSSAAFNNIFHTNSPTPVVLDGNEGNPIVAPSPFT